MAFVEDLPAYLADFGDGGTLAGAAVRVIFDAPSATELGSVAMATQVPQAQIVSASVPGAVYGASLVIPQGSFTVLEHIPDGTGMSLLVLQRAA